MNTHEENLKLIAAYLSGHLTGADRDHLKKWIAESPENEKMFNDATRIWKYSGAKLQASYSDTDVLWQELKSRIEANGRDRQFIPFFVRHKTVFQVAASVIVLFALAVYLFPRKSKLASQKIAAIPSADVVFTSGEQVAMIYLPDSSKVWLGRKSKLLHPASFGRKTRPVSLEGEAYFEVVSDTASMFSVAVLATTIEVVGTAFNVKAEGNSVAVSVAKGEVKFSDNNTGTTVSLKPKEHAVWNQVTGIVKEPDHDPAVAEWRRSNNLQFEKERARPQDFLKTSYTWQKNALQRSVIKGKIKNKATLAEYRDIVLRISYKKANGKEVTIRENLSRNIQPGHDLDFEKRLRDLFSNTRDVRIEIESAKLTDQN